jgi:2-keto-3-deoxy-L-rhamnonate aldolase RhmA
MIGRLLDGGAHGIVFPRIDTVEQAHDACQACRFPPHGRRSAIAMVPQLGMRPTPAKVLDEALDELTTVQVLLETPEAIANAAAIAALDGVDILAIGANDLTAELGVPGDYHDPRVREAVASVAEACRRHGKLLQLGGIGDLALVASLLPLGICPLQLTGNDAELLYSAALARVEKFAAWHQNESRG